MKEKQRVSKQTFTECGKCCDGDTLGVGVGGRLIQTWGGVRESFPEKESAEQKTQHAVLAVDTAGLGKLLRNHRDVDSGL